MLNRFQRLVVGLAKSAGFSAIWPSWRDRLVALRGEFRRSTSERVFWYVFEALSIFFGSAILALCVRNYLRWGFTLWPVGVMGLMTVSVGLYAITRNGRWYRLDQGVLTALRHNGQTVWQENLAGLTAITFIRGRGGFVTTLTLHWPPSHASAGTLRFSRSSTIYAPQIVVTADKYVMIASVNLVNCIAHSTAERPWARETGTAFRICSSPERIPDYNQVIVGKLWAHRLCSKIVNWRECSEIVY